MYDTLKTTVGLYGSIGFMYHTNIIFDKYNREFIQIIKKYRSIIYLLYDLMMKIVKECEDSNIYLDTIISRLRWYSFRNKHLLQGYMIEILTTCTRLNNNFDRLNQLNIKVVNQASLFKKTMDQMLMRFKVSRFAYTIKYTLFGMAEGGYMLNRVFNNIPLSVLIGVLGVHLGMFCTSFEKKNIEMTLNDQIRRTINITYKCKDSQEKIKDIMDHFKNYKETVIKNRSYGTSSVATETRVMHQLKKLINDTKVIQLKLQGLKNEARIKAKDISRMILVENNNYILYKS